MRGHYELTIRSFFTLQVNETNRSSESLHFGILKRDLSSGIA